MVPFVETIKTKEALIEECKKGFKDYQSGKISKNDFCMYFGFTHGEAITKFYPSNPGELLTDGGFNSGSEAYFNGGINAWKNLRDGKYTFPLIKVSSSNDFHKSNAPLQKIWFGTPGSGKSYAVKKFIKDRNGEMFRTTFHPDSDYATFVGSYKPVKKDNGLTYEFVPQTFTEAYMAAWKEHGEESGKEIFLVIEEINRGNCAQIFGDIFQLLDRGADGMSEYPIKADKDLCKYLESDEALGSGHPGIAGGNLRLPANLHVYATMNTSDQSLFPMDSAFKRRWDWEYVSIDLKCPESQFKITIGDTVYSWPSFLEKVNERIHTLSDSEDKQMGNFFIKNDVGVEEFKSKVMFYLWSEVCKEYEKSGSFFKNKRSGDAEFTFNSLFPTNDVTNSILQGFMEYLGVDAVSTPQPSGQPDTDSESHSEAQ